MTDWDSWNRIIEVCIGQSNMLIRFSKLPEIKRFHFLHELKFKSQTKLSLCWWQFFRVKFYIEYVSRKIKKLGEKNFHQQVSLTTARLLWFMIPPLATKRKELHHFKTKKIRRYFSIQEVFRMTGNGRNASLAWW